MRKKKNRLVQDDSICRQEQNYYHQEIKISSGKVENNMGKGENAGYQCFQKAFFLRVVKPNMLQKEVNNFCTSIFSFAHYVFKSFLFQAS